MNQICDTLIQAKYIITQNEHRTVLEGCGVAVTGNEISAVGPWKELTASWNPKQTMQLGNAILMPGLVNAHTHAAMTMLRGVADDLPLMEWLTKHIFPIEQHLTTEQVELGAMLACAEMTRYGITSFVDMYLFEDAAFRAVDKSGLRALGGEAIYMFPSPAYPNVEAGVELIHELHEKWKVHPRVNLAIMPHAVYTSTPEILTQCKEIADTLSLPVHLHLAETAEETAQSLASFGKRPVPYVHELGLLGPATTIAHGVDLTPEEIDILAETKTTVAHNPESNMKLASGFAPIPQMLEKNVTVALGTDGAASNNSLNIFTEMTSCALLHKIHTMNPICTPAQAVLDMATLGGAKAMNRSDIGSIQQGQQADLIALDIEAPNLQPMHNPVSQTVYAANGSEVCMTMVAGEVLYRAGKYTKLDYSSLLEEVQSLRNWVTDKL